MLCENCGRREANVNYLENINGVKKELHLCDICSEKLGINSEIERNMQFAMPMDIPSLFGSLFEDFAKPDFMPIFDEENIGKCKSCGSIFDDIISTGRLGCPNCYHTFESKMDPILKRIQGANRHVGRLGKISDNEIKAKESNKQSKKEENKLNKKEQLEQELKQAIKEERYEDAAKIRDEIKKNSK